MKQYIIDELRLSDYQKIKTYLDDTFETGSMEGLYWMPLDRKLWSNTQAKHPQCQPFYVALDLTETQLSCEFLIRSHNRIRCECIHYADESQRNWIIRSIDAIFKKLEIHA
ncbi:MAG: hypothetical protein PVI90_07280 [Desulfobacteraceae bacterium]|jgi:hypothetical protein